MSTDPGRPRLHLTPPTGWLNDPHGLIWHGDAYHLFYQAVPGGTTWAPGVAWGHATSPDLLTWEHLPLALEPGEGDLGCWSGSVVTGVDGSPRIFYTAVAGPDLDLGVVRRAVPEDPRLIRWRKADPVVTSADAAREAPLRVFRDPQVLRDGPVWRMLVGGGGRDGRPSVVGFSSPDLETWTPDGDVVAGVSPPAWAGRAWECPNLVEVAGRHVLFVSVWDEGTACMAAAVGTYAGGRFVADRWVRVAGGPRGPYAGSVFRDAVGRPCVLFWLRGVADEAAGWAGAISVPYVVGVVDDGLALEPHPVVRGVGGIPGVAVLDWSPGGVGETVRLVDDEGHTLAMIVLEGEEVVLRSDRDEARLPVGGSIALVADGPVVEASSGSALASLLVPPGRGGCSWE